VKARTFLSALVEARTFLSALVEAPDFQSGEQGFQALRHLRRDKFAL
jgi:hypothetical protein